MEEDILIEKLASLIHDEWCDWSKEIAKTENISQKRLKRWIRLWIPYSELKEETKEVDRGWARKVVEIFKENHDVWKNKQKR